MISYAHGARNKFFPVLVKNMDIREGEVVKIISPQYSNIYARVLLQVQTPFSSLSPCLLAVMMNKAKTTKREAQAFFKTHQSSIVTVLWVEKIPYFTGKAIEEKSQQKQNYNPETDAWVTDPAQKKIESAA